VKAPSFDLGLFCIILFIVFPTNSQNF